jgi:hypothetical protein
VCTPARRPARKTNASRTRPRRRFPPLNVNVSLRSPPSSSQTASSVSPILSFDLQDDPRLRNSATRTAALACSRSPCFASTTVLAPTPRAHAVLDVASHGRGRPTSKGCSKEHQRAHGRHRRRLLVCRSGCVDPIVSLSRSCSRPAVARALRYPAYIPPRRIREDPSRSPAPMRHSHRSRRTAPVALHARAAGVSGHSGSYPARHARRTRAADLDRALQDDDGQAGGVVRVARRGEDATGGLESTDLELVGHASFPGTPRVVFIRLFLLSSSHPSTPAVERAVLAPSRTRRGSAPARASAPRAGRDWRR